MQELSERCVHLMHLINTKEKDDLWLDETCATLWISRHAPEDLALLLSKWKPEWGRTDGDAVSFVWSRPDHGPAIVDDLPIPLNIKILKMMLRAELIAALQECGHVSYVEVGYPENWQRCQVLRNGKPVEGVKKACAIANICFALDDRGDERTLSGLPIRIVVQPLQTSFF